jgi:uncharacterized protein (DUF433 family)
VATKIDIYGGKDPRDLPAYTAAEAAQFVRVPNSTVRAWCFGQAVPSRDSHFKPVLLAADPRGRMLSFKNLVELFVLASLTRRHRVRLGDVRTLVRRMRERGSSKHPLADATLSSDEAGQLFVEEAGHVLNVSARWQEEMKPIVAEHLRRVERDAHGIPRKLFPFTTTRLEDTRRPVVIDPRVSFGQPCLAGTGIPVVNVVERWEAGDDIGSIARDYGRPPNDVEEAIRFLRAA